MTRTLIAAALLLFTACVNDSPLYLLGFFPLPLETCTEIKFGDTQQGAGSLDLAGGGAYAIGMKLRSELDDSLDTVAGNKTLSKGTHRNTVVLDQINLTYTAVPSSITLENETVPVTFSIPPNSENPIFLGSLLGPKAIEKLSTSLPNPGDRADIRVKLTFSGNIISGGRIASTPATFPISIGRSTLPTCPAGSVLGRTGPCGRIGGQDGTPICCDSDLSTPECD